jgi:hypothetical protein
MLSANMCLLIILTNPDMNRELGTTIHPDVHSITVHRTSSDLVTAATGGGLYRSADGG